MKRQSKIINNLEVALRESKIKQLHLEALLNGFTNQLGFDCIKFEDESKGIHIKIDVDPRTKINGSYVVELRMLDDYKKPKFFSLNSFSIIDFLRDKPQQQIKLS